MSIRSGGGGVVSGGEVDTGKDFVGRDQISTIVSSGPDVRWEFLLRDQIELKDSIYRVETRLQILTIILIFLVLAIVLTVLGFIVIRQFDVQWVSSQMIEIRRLIHGYHQPDFPFCSGQ